MRRFLLRSGSKYLTVPECPAVPRRSSDIDDVAPPFVLDPVDTRADLHRGRLAAFHVRHPVLRRHGSHGECVWPAGVSEMAEDSLCAAIAAVTGGGKEVLGRSANASPSRSRKLVSTLPL